MMIDFTKTESGFKKKFRKLKELASELSLIVVGIGILGLAYLDFYKSNNFKVNIREKRAYWFQVSEGLPLFTHRSFNASEYKDEKKAWVTFNQRNLIKKDYYCTDDAGKDSNFPDGLADKVRIGKKEFLREKDYYGNEKIFHEADQNIAKVHNVLRKEFPEYDEITQTQL